MPPLVSIIMNCYNGATYVRQALDSIWAQNFTQWEVIFWDNASSDASAHIAQSYGAPLRYYRSQKTLPLGEARNCALQQAQGKYIAFLDCDDIWLPHKLEQQVALMEARPHVGLVCTDTEIFNGTRSYGRIFARAKPQRGHALDALMLRQWVSMSSVLLRRDAMNSVAEYGQYFDPCLKVCEEADLFYRIAYVWSIDHIDNILTRWRLHTQSSTFFHFEQFADETLYILQKQQKLHADFTSNYAHVITELTRRAAFQHAVAQWRTGHGAAARSNLTPYTKSWRKARLFFYVTFLPSTCFRPIVHIYFFLRDYLNARY